MAQSMTSWVTDVLLSPTVISVYFLTVENWYKVDYQQRSEQFCFGRGHGLFGLILAALLLPAKLIAYFCIENCFKCDYNHCSAVAFGNTRLTLRLKNVLRLWIRYLVAIANLGVILVLNESCLGVICNSVSLPHWCCHEHQFNKWFLLSILIS